MARMPQLPESLQQDEAATLSADIREAAHRLFALIEHRLELLEGGWPEDPSTPGQQAAGVRLPPAPAALDGRDQEPARTTGTGMPTPPGVPSGRSGGEGAVTGVFTPARPCAPLLGGEHDRELVRRIAGSDPAALGELYDRWSAPVYALGVCILGTEDAAEEVLESTFWQVWRSAPEFERAGTCVGAQLLAAARGRALDRVHARSLDRRRDTRG